MRKPRYGSRRRREQMVNAQRVLMESEQPDVWTSRLLPWVVGVAALLIYIRTLTPGMQTGDGTELAAMAHVMGVPHPTGYPLYMLLMKLWLMVTLGGEVILRTTLFNGVCIAAAVGVLTNVLLSIITAAWPDWPAKLRVLAATAGALGTGFLRLHWNSAVVTEVYALEFLLMVGFLRAAQLWGKSKSDRTFLAMALLLGLGLAHHRISVFMVLPFLWIAWRMPSAEERLDNAYYVLAYPRTYAAAVIAVCLLLYLYLPLRSASAALAWGSTNTWSGFWDHVRGKEYFFRSMLRAAPDRAFTLDTWLIFAGHQAQQFFMDAVTQMMPLRERLITNPVVGRYFSGLTVLGVVALVVIGAAAITGFVRWLRVQPVLAICAALIAAQNFLFLFIYNIPDIRDYTLLPLAFVWWCGFLGVLVGIDRPVRRALDQQGTGLPQSLGYLLLIFPLFFAIGNWRACNQSDETLAEDISALVLPSSTEIMPDGSILLTGGDVDTFTSWYRQHVRGERRDVLVYASNFIHMPWYPKFFTDEEKAEYSLGFSNKVPYDPAEFVLQLEAGILEPNLQKTSIFTSSQDPKVLALLASRYRLRSILAMAIEEQDTTFTLYQISPRDPAP